MSRTKKDTKKYREDLWEKSIPVSVGEMSSKFKKNQKRSRRSKEKEAFKKGKEDPNFKKTDKYDWW